jgi:hypothetical protein
VIITGVIISSIAGVGSKFSGGEWNFTEHFTGVLCAAGTFTAFLAGNAVLHNRHYQLGIPFQANNGELTQCDEKPTAISGQNQFFIE